MPSTICADNFNKPSSATDACAVFTAMLALNERARALAAYIVDCDNGNLPNLEFAREVGGQIFWPGYMTFFETVETVRADVEEEVRRIWLTSDEIADPATEPFWELVTTFDGRFPLIANFSGHEPGDAGGSETVALTTAQLPAHTHEYTDPTFRSPDAEGVEGGGSPGTNQVRKFVTPNGRATTSTGSGEGHDNMPPYRVTCLIRRTGRFS